MNDGKWRGQELVRKCEVWGKPLVDSKLTATLRIIKMGAIGLVSDMEMVPQE